MKQQSSWSTDAYQWHQKSKLGLSRSHWEAQSQDLINSLPELCMMEIFRFLEEPRDLQSCAQVCWRWAHLLVSLQPSPCHPSCNQPNHHPILFLSGPDVVDPKLAALVIGTCSRDDVTHLDLQCSSHGTVSGPGDSQLTDKGIEFVTHACRNLQLIFLCNCSSVTDRGMAAIASNCFALQNLILENSSITDIGIFEIAEKCTNLNLLYIKGCSLITNASVRALGQYAKKLTYLSFGSCPSIPDNSIISFLVERPDLTVLQLEHMLVGELVHRAISPRKEALPNVQVEAKSSLQVVAYSGVQLFHRLHSLILVKCPGLQDSISPIFVHVHFPTLKCLVIEDCRDMTQHGLVCLVYPSVMLETIILKKFQFSTYAGLMEVLSLCAWTIKLLTLELCTFDNVAPLRPGEPVAQECPLLEAVRLQHSSNILELLLVWLRKACHEVKDFRFIGMDTIAEDRAILSYLYRMALHCRITKIELSRSCYIDDTHVSLILSGCRGALQELILDGCLHIMGFFMLFLWEYCPNLVKLSIGGSQISDRMMKLLMAEGFAHLEELGLVECTEITDETLMFLRESWLPVLSKLNVSGCTGITQETVEWYRQMWDIEY